MFTRVEMKVLVSHFRKTFLPIYKKMTKSSMWKPWRKFQNNIKVEIVRWFSQNLNVLEDFRENVNVSKHEI
jgi:hypothetical protein